MENRRTKISRVVQKNKGYIFLALLITIILITWFRVLIQMYIGPSGDTYTYLSNALLFAGYNGGYSNLTLPPLLSFLTSLFFRLGYVAPATIFAVDGAIFVFGVIGFYLLLKTRFNDIGSFLGSLLFVTFPVVLSFVGFGLTDVPSISFSIWAIYFTVLAVKRNSKFFYLAFPFLMLAFLTRYAAALIIFPILFYILINRNVTKYNIKNVLIGVFLSFLFVIPVLMFFYSTFGNPLYPFFNFYGSTSTSSVLSPENFSYNPDLFYFLFRMPIYIGMEGVAVILIILLGIVVYGIDKLEKGKLLGRKRFLNPLKLEMAPEMKLTLSLILLMVFLGTFGKMFYMVSELIFLVLSCLMYESLKSFDIEGMDLNFLFLSWFMAFFIFHSVYVMKDDRYFLTMTPAISYFLILGLSEVSSKLKYKIKNSNIKFTFFAVVLAAMILLSAAAYLHDFQKSSYEIKVADEQINSASEWLMNYDPNYKTKIIYSDKWSAFGWHLKTNVGKVPIFKDNQTFYNGVKDNNISPQDNMVFNHYLESSNAEYYFCIRKGLNLTSYKPIKQFGDVIIYEKSM